MTRINWLRLIIGGLIVSVICFLTDGFFHERVVATDWSAVYRALGVAEPHHDATGLIYFAIFELGRGFAAILVYVLMRPFFRPGPKTAVLAGVVTWLAFSVTGPAQFVPLGFYSQPLWIKVAGFQLVTTLIGVLVGAALYKDA